MDNTVNQDFDTGIEESEESRSLAVRSGKKEQLPYSLSRWTDLPLAKWAWFEQQLDQGWMVGFDPKTATPHKWSLDPAETYGLIFWTKNPRNLILNAERLAPYQVAVHVTLTGWTEVERGVPDMDEGVELIQQAVSAFGAERVTWRFSPVPQVDDVIRRFDYLAKRISQTGLLNVYVAFLQENDRVPELRSRRARLELLKQMAVHSHGLDVILCNEDRTLKESGQPVPPNLLNGICESGVRFATQIYDVPDTEGCGCGLAVDPFTINESCGAACEYCYAADQTVSVSKHNTTKRKLALVR